METGKMHKRMKKLSAIIDPTADELYERVNLCIQIYNARRDEITDEEIARTRAFLSSDLYTMVSVCYQPALDDLIHTDIEMQKAESRTYMIEFEKAKEKKFSPSQAMDIARKSQKENDEYIQSYKNFHNAKNIVNIYDKTMKMGSQVLNSMARRARES
jgi:hypothetical protein